MGAKAANVEPAVAWLMAQAEFSHVDLAPYPAGPNAKIDAQINRIAQELAGEGWPCSSISALTSKSIKHRRCIRTDQ